VASREWLAVVYPAKAKRLCSRHSGGVRRYDVLLQCDRYPTLRRICIVGKGFGWRSFLVLNPIPSRAYACWPNSRVEYAL
jgi:hypothetical protein